MKDPNLSGNERLEDVMHREPRKADEEDQQDEPERVRSPLSARELQAHDPAKGEPQGAEDEPPRAKRPAPEPRTEKAPRKPR